MHHNLPAPDKSEELALSLLQICPPQTHATVHRERRTALAQLARSVESLETVVVSAGWARPRNFSHNVFPFRAESHFLHFVGRSIEGALLVLFRGEFCLYVDEPEPELALWEGARPSLADLEETLELRVRPLSDLLQEPRAAILPPQDEESAQWVSEILGRPVFAQSGPELEGADAALAEVLVALRLTHDQGGVAQLRYAAFASTEAHRAGMARTPRSTRESQIRGAIEGAFISAGLSPGYNSIVTTRGEVLHAKESTGSLRPGDLLLCDAGGETPEGYTADITRVWPVSGAFSPTQRDVYQAVLDVQKRAIARAAPGVHYRDLHLSATRDLGEHLQQLGILRGSLDALCEGGAVSVFFPHGLGHLLGLDVHDMEDLGDRAGYVEGAKRSMHPAEAYLRLSRPLAAGMCVTIEPGFYQIPHLLAAARGDRQLAALIDFDRLGAFADVRGVRIEDDVLVTDAGCEVLTAHAPKEIAELEEILAS